MSLQIFEAVYSGSRLTRAQTLLSIEAITGEIKSISVNAPNVQPTGDYIFNASLNGTNLFSGSERITINRENKRVEKNALSVETDEADILTFALEAIGQAGLLAPIYFIVTIDDGINAETDIAADVHAAAAKATPIDADELGIVDSAASNVLKKTTWAQIKATLNTIYEKNTASNVGSGDGIFKEKSGVDLRFKSLVAGANVTITASADSVEIAATDSGGGGGAEELDDLTDVAITSPTTGQILKFDGSVWKNGTDSTGSGGGNGFALFAEPSTGVHAKTDYFKEDDAKWSGFHTDLATFSVLDGAARVSQNSGTAYAAKVQELTSGDFTIITRLFYPSKMEQFAIGGISLFENPIAAPNTSKFFTCEMITIGANYYLFRRAKFSDYQTYDPSFADGNTSVAADEYNPIYLKLTRSGTNIDACYSKNGVNFPFVSSVSQSSLGFTPTYFGYHVGNIGTGGVRNWIFDFIYYEESYNAELPGGLI